VLPLVRGVRPDAHLAIVGRDPTPAVRALDALEGVRVVGPVDDIRSWITQSQVWAGPFVTHTLAALGAEVIKVESIQRPDGIRFASTKPPTHDGWWEWSALFQGFNLGKRGIAISRSLTAGLPPVHGDSNALQQVMVNLLANAADALGSGGEISLETRLVSGDEGGVRLTVRDTGPGISPEILPRIFDPFYTTKSEGTGLGLSISYSIVREHKGTIDVESLPGKGTIFVLTFPAVGRDVRS